MTQIVFNAPASPTPNSVMGEVTDDICTQWGINDAYEALPNSLSYNHAKYAMAWGEPFLILLSDLATLTPGKLEEVQNRLRKRIDYGRRMRRGGREQWVMPADLKASITHYSRARLEAVESAIEDQGQHHGQEVQEQDEIEAADEESEDQQPAGEQEEIPQAENEEPYTSNNPRRSARTCNTKKTVLVEDQDQDEDYVPLGRNNLSRRCVASTAAHGAKRKRGQHGDAEESYAPVTLKRARNLIRKARGRPLVPVAPVDDSDRQEGHKNALQPRDDEQRQGRLHAPNGPQEPYPGYAQVQEPGAQQAVQHDLQPDEPQDDQQAPDQGREMEQHIIEYPDRRGDILSWRAVLPAASLRQKPPTVASVSDGVDVMGLEQTFAIS